MDVIRVPAPPKEAFHKERPISDLIRSQVKHFKHLEAKLSAEELRSIPQHRITTENDAAIYIAAMTRLLRSGVGKTGAASQESSFSSTTSSEAAKLGSKSKSSAKSATRTKK